MIKSVKEITLVSLMTTILFVQEQLLTHIPGVQLTVLLIVLFAKKFGFIKSSIIIIIYVLLDNLYMSSTSLYTPFMLIGWLIIPLTLSTIFKKVEHPILLALLGALYSFIYCWMYIIPACFIFNMDLLIYLLSDIVFEIIFAVCSFISILILYKPCSKVIDISMG